MMKRLPSKLLFTFLTLLFITQAAFPQPSNFSSRLSPLIPPEARSNGKLGVVVKSLTTNEKIFEHNAQKLFVPASNMKVITSVAALSLLKKDYRFKTEFYSGGELNKGVLHGGVYIKGSGDPSLVTEQLRYIAFQLKKKGVKEIRGDITVDDSFFDATRYAEGWKEEWRMDYYSPPISSLSLNQNLFKIKVYPRNLGAPPLVKTEPEGTGINIINKASTNNGRAGISARWQDKTTLIIRGSVRPKGSHHEIELPVSEPSLYLGSIFKNALQSAGIKLEGAVKKGEVPRWALPLYTHTSAPLTEIITEYNKNSVNMIGENLIKTLGAKFKGEPGTWEKGSNVISEFLRKMGIEGGFWIVDGSGLSYQNRVSPEAFAEVLQFAYSNRLIASEFLTSLPVAGVDGTLKKRFRGSQIQGRVMAKTGYLKNARALSGFMITKHKDVLVFSILSNDLGWKGKEFQNNLLRELVNCCKTDGVESN